MVVEGDHIFGRMSFNTMLCAHWCNLSVIVGNPSNNIKKRFQWQNSLARSIMKFWNFEF